MGAITILSVRVRKLNVFLTLVLLMAGPLEQLAATHISGQPVTKPQPFVDCAVTDVLQVRATNCSNSYLSLNTTTQGDKGILLPRDTLTWKLMGNKHAEYTWRLILLTSYGLCCWSTPGAVVVYLCYFGKAHCTDDGTCARFGTLQVQI